MWVWECCFIICWKFGFFEFDHEVVFNLWFYHSCVGYLDRNRFAFMRETAAAIVMQKYVKCWFLRHKHMQLCAASLLIQSSIRGFLFRQKFLYWKEHRAATVIQVVIRFCYLCLEFSLRSSCTCSEYICNVFVEDNLLGLSDSPWTVMLCPWNIKYLRNHIYDYGLLEACFALFCFMLQHALLFAWWKMLWKVTILH